MTYEAIRYELTDGIATITLNRPEVHNAMNERMREELTGCFGELAGNDGARVVVVTGAGERAFSAGNDLKVQAAGGRRGPRPKSDFAGLVRRFDLDKPLIAAVNGVAMGGGFETALACDIIVAAENAVFALPEPRVGLMAGSGVHRLPRVIPQKQALGMILTGRRGAFEAASQRALGMLCNQAAAALFAIRVLEREKEQAVRDGLTGLYNRREFDRLLRQTVAREGRRPEGRFALLLLDIDHFKRVNDTFGHDAGDAVLRRMGLVLQGHVRGSDIACRIGGEEFALLLPEASLVIAYQRAERILDTVRHMQIKHRGQVLGAITVSLGVAAFPKHGETPEALIRAADQALYQAKQGGRNKLASA